MNSGTRTFQTQPITICTDLHQQRGKKRFRIGTDTHQKAEGLMASGGLNGFMASRPQPIISNVQLLPCSSGSTVTIV